jgi:membrane protease subunit (stomatin/prohibitin family)
MSSMYGTGNKVPTGYKLGQLQQFTPEQMQLFKSLFSHVTPGSYLSRLAGGDQSLYEEMEAPSLRQFSEIQGGLASRFSGMGMGSRNSSGFQNTSNAAASQFAQDMQSRRQELQRQAIMELMGLSNNLLGQRPYEQFLYEKKKPFWQQLLGGALPLGGSLIGGAMGGPTGAMIGGQAGSAAGQAFY